MSSRSLDNGGLLGTEGPESPVDLGGPGGLLDTGGPTEPWGMECIP